MESKKLVAASHTKSSTVWSHLLCCNLTHPAGCHITTQHITKDKEKIQP